MADVRNHPAYGIARQHQSGAPAAPAHDIERQITRVAHLCGARHGGAERAHDGHETGQNHRLTTVFLVKRVGAFQMAALEECRILAAVNRLPRTPPDPIAKLVPGNRAEGNQGHERSNLERSSRAKHAGRYQQRIARQEKTHKQPRFHKHDHAHQQGSAPLDQFLDVIQVMQQASD